MDIKKAALAALAAGSLLGLSNGVASADDFALDAKEDVTAPVEAAGPVQTFSHRFSSLDGAPMQTFSNRSGSLD